jgi:hypothetical protein
MANGYLVAKSGCVYKHNQRDQGETEMAEGLLGGILGGEDEEKAASTEAGPEAFVAAVATNMANHSPEVAAKTATFFEEQTELVKAQSKSVEAEHQYFEAEWGPRLLALRLRTGFQIFIALFATVTGIRTLGQPQAWVGGSE